MASTTLTLIGKPGCHLCDDARAVVTSVLADFSSVALEEFSILDDPALYEKYVEDIPVLLVGVVVPPNMGAAYAARFNPIYARLAEKYQLPLYPFILDGVVLQPGLQLEDGMHPNGKGVGVMADRMLPVVEQFSRTIMDKAK